jgi:hypothetical protein
VLEGLERDLKAVRKAREVLGDKAPTFGNRDRDQGGSTRGGFGQGGRGGHVLGKRRRDEDESEESDVPDDVKSIPMPRDTPPPIPKEVLDKWYAKRRERFARDRAGGDGDVGRGTNANNTPLGQSDRRAKYINAEGLPDLPGEGVERAEKKVVVEAKTVYEAKPAIRDLRKEAVSFVPAAVRVKMEKGRGVGGLVEPEEADRLERAGYMGVRKPGDKGAGGEDGRSDGQKSRAVVMEEVDDEDG